MLDWAKTFLKATPLVFFAVAVASGVCLFAPARFLTRLKLEFFIKSYQPYIGAAFLLSVASLAAHLFYWFYPYVLGWLAAHYLMRKGYKRLHRLTPDEKEILRDFVLNQTRATKLRSDSSPVLGLETAKILWRPQQIVQPKIDYRTNEVFYLITFQVSDWAWDYLLAHSSLYQSTELSE
jgi:hypothetical protein